MKNAKRLNNENLQLKAELLAAAELVENKDKTIKELDYVICSMSTNAKHLRGELAQKENECLDLKGELQWLRAHRNGMARMLTDKDTSINELVADKVALQTENALIEKKFKRFRIIHLTGELVALALIVGSFLI